MAGTTTEQIKEKLDIVQFIRDYVALNPAGRNFKGLCPFHREKTPSFMVSPERQSWHCFGCNIGGDVFAFLMRYENIEFGEALRILAEKAGVELRRVNPAEYKFAGLLHEINAVAKNYFVEQLKKAPVPQKYLKERGLKQETLDEFEIGWAPNESEGLNLFLMKQKYAPDDIVRSGLVIQSDKDRRRFDRFRGRIMFPIHDHFGKPVGFTGRILPQFDTGNPSTGSGQVAKYMNSPETPIFNKSKILYGFDITKSIIRDAGEAFLVEGQMDLLMSYQAGVKNVAASSGTALTPDHLRTLRRLVDKLVVSFDSDEAGIEATERAIDLAESMDFSVRVVQFGTYKDPAEAAQAGVEVLQKAIAAAVPAPQFYFDKYLPFDPAPFDTSQGRRGKPIIDRRDRSYLKSVRAVLAKLKAMASPVDRDFWMKELSRRLSMEERVLREEAERIEVKSPNVRTSAGSEEAKAEPEEKQFVSRWDLLSERLVAACLAKADFTSLGEHAEYLTADYRMMYDLFSKGDRKSGDARLDELMNTVMLRADDLSEREIGDLKQHLYGEYIKERRRELIGRIKRAEAEGNETALTSAFQEFNQLPAL